MVPPELEAGYQVAAVAMGIVSRHTERWGNWSGPRPLSGKGERDHGLYFCRIREISAAQRGKGRDLNLEVGAWPKVSTQVLTRIDLILGTLDDIATLAGLWHSANAHRLIAPKR